MTISRRAFVAGPALLAATRAACAAPAPVRVGSKPDTEGSLLGAMIIALLEAKGIPTVNRVGLGPTKIVRAALLAGQIDIYPEYTGNGAFFFGQDSDPVWRNAAEGYARVRQLDLERNGLVWLRPAAANNTWAIAVRKDVAETRKMRSMEDFAREVNGSGGIKLAASAEFVESPAALPAFQSAYGFAMKAGQLVILAGGNTAVTLRAAAEGTSGVNAAMAYGTDGELSALDLVVMDDPKGAQLVFAPAPVMRKLVLDAYPAVTEALDPAFGSLDAATLRSLNGKIAVEGADPKTVAVQYLRQKGFLG